jgi:carboxypeptidase family protein
MQPMRSLAVAAVVVLTVGCDRQQTPSGPSSVGVSGRVIDFSSGVGVSGASVVFGETTAMTDANGKYTIDHLASGQYEPRVDGAWMGQSRVTGPGYRGDLLVRPGTCVSRYGTLADARTRRPVAGAIVGFVGPGLNARTVSGLDGWYRIDLGCPANGLVGFNTTALSVSHPNYVDPFQPVGRGVGGATRLDLDLEPR